MLNPKFQVVVKLILKLSSIAKLLLKGFVLAEDLKKFACGGLNALVSLVRCTGLKFSICSRLNTLVSLVYCGGLKFVACGGLDAWVRCTPFACVLHCIGLKFFA